MHKGHLYSVDTGTSQNVGCNVFIYENINYFSPCKNEADNDATQWFHEIFSLAYAPCKFGNKDLFGELHAVRRPLKCIEKCVETDLLSCKFGIDSPKDFVLQIC